MNKDQVKGKIDEVVGSAKNKAGELVGNTKLEVEGMAQHLKGKVECAVGDTKEGIHKTCREAETKYKSCVDAASKCASTVGHRK